MPIQCIITFHSQYNIYEQKTYTKITFLRLTMFRLKQESGKMKGFFLQFDIQFMEAHLNFPSFIKDKTGQSFNINLKM
jgi:hypothetical protein